MYFALCRLAFDGEGFAGDEDRELHQLVEKIRARYRVCVRPQRSADNSGYPAIVISSLHPNKNQLSQQLDEIAEFCEKSGSGRLHQETALIEHLDFFEEFQ